MAIWPFSRRRKRRRKAGDEETTATAADGHGTAQSQVPQNGSSTYAGKPSRRDSKRRKRDLGDSQRQGDETVDLSHIHPAFRNQAQSASMRGASLSHPSSVDAYLSRNYAVGRLNSTAGLSETSLGRSFPYPPTLNAGRRSTEPNVLRRKSSKRKRNDPAREREVKNMSATMPMSGQPETPATKRWGSQRRLNDENRRPVDRIVDLSAYQPDSGRSSPSEYESHAYRVGAFDALSPRPILRYAQYTSPGSREPSRASARRDAGRPPFTGDAGEANRRRIEELADDMDASALRELMERDARRREMRRLKDQEKLQQKLQKRAERQRIEERRMAAREEASRERDNQTGRADESARASSEARPVDQQRDPMVVVKSPSHSGSWLQDPSKDSLVAGNGTPEKAAPKWPLPDTVIGSTPPRQLNSVDSREYGTISDARASSASPVTTKQGTVSTSQLASASYASTSDISQSIEKRQSDNSGKVSASWTSIFRRGGTLLRRKQEKERNKEQSEFSVSSREPFTKNSQPQLSAPDLPVPERSFKRVSPSMKRSQSKFTEHLNDFPLPPTSKPQTPDVPATIEDEPTSLNDMTTQPITVPEPRGDRFSSRATSPEARPDSVLLAQSLASIDSEGSWLSGKPSRRVSQITNNRASGSTAPKEKVEEQGELGETEESFLEQSSGGDDAVPRNSGDNNEGEGTLHASVGKRPTFIRPDSRTKSREVLLSDYRMGESGSNSPASPLGGEGDEEAEPEVRRATSIDFGKGKGHARQISAGSAKLLDLPRRSSDIKRLSQDSTGTTDHPADKLEE